MKFSGTSFKKVFGDGYLRPFELATFRLNNMSEIIKNWGDYIINEKYLPQRGATFLLNYNNQDKDLDIFAIAIGNQNGKEKFCKFTGFSKENLIVVSNNQIHNNLKVSRGLNIGFGGWINMLLMLSGINSFRTIKEVIRGYTGDRKAKQIYSEFDKIDVLKFLKFSGNSFKKVFGDGYLRPFELATFRLNNMNEIIQNWSDYIINEEYLPQRGASFLLNNKNQVIYKFFSNDVLGYSSNMRDPLEFLTDLIK